MKDFVIDPSLLDASEYKPSQMGSCMLFTRQGQAKFANFEDADKCASVYAMLARQREELIVERKNK